MVADPELGLAGHGAPRPRRSLRQRGVERDYRKRRAWRKRTLLACYLGVAPPRVVHIKNDVAIEGASQELLEAQRQEVSVG